MIRSRTYISLRLWFAGALCVLLSGALLDASADTLDKVRANGFVRCGVNEDAIGFAKQGADGRWQGMNVDLCRAVAAATLGDASRIRLTPLPAASRFPALLAGQVDLLTHSTTLTLGREATIGVEFPGIFYFDGSGILVARQQRPGRVEDLNGKTVCTEKGTTGESVLLDTFLRLKLSVTPLEQPTLHAAIDALNQGRCQGLLSDRSRLAAIRAMSAEYGERFELLPDSFSKEPLGPAVRHGDENWYLIVRWVLFALIEAEEMDVTRANVQSLRAEPARPGQRRLLIDSGKLAKGLHLQPDWAEKVIAAVGNYAELFQRNLGEGSGLQLDRGYNRLWRYGGLLYAPPFR